MSRVLAGMTALRGSIFASAPGGVALTRQGISGEGTFFEPQAAPRSGQVVTASIVSASRVTAHVAETLGGIAGAGSAARMI